MEYHNSFHIIWYNITIWYGNIAILYGTTYSLLKYTYNTVGLRRISFFSEICSPRSVTTFFAQTPPPPSTKNAPTAQPLSACYWRTFHQELRSHRSKNVTKFWKKGFEILQNIQDRLTLQKHLKRPRDPIFMTTVNEKPNKEKKTKTQSTDENKVMDILQVGSLLK